MKEYIKTQRILIVYMELLYCIDEQSGQLNSGIYYSFEVKDKYLESLRSKSPQLGDMYLGFTYHYLKGGFIKYQADGGFELGFDENEEPYISANDGKVEKRVSRSVKKMWRLLYRGSK